MKPINLILLVHNEIEREGLRRILADQSLSIVGCYADCASIDPALQLDMASGSPVILIDLLTSTDNLEACRDLRARWPHSRVVIFTSKCDGQSVADALSAGADGFVAKHTLVSSLGKMLMLVGLGEKIIPADAFLSLPRQPAIDQLSCDHGDFAKANLSERELQILGRLVQGDANKVISRRMDISEATVKVHVKAILRKLSVANRTQAAIWGVARGLGSMPAASFGTLAAQAKAHPNARAY